MLARNILLRRDFLTNDWDQAMKFEPSPNLGKNRHSSSRAKNIIFVIIINVRSTSKYFYYGTSHAKIICNQANHRYEDEIWKFEFRKGEKNVRKSQLRHK